MPAAQHTVISGRGTMISVLPNNRRLWQQGEGCSNASHSTCCDKWQRMAKVYCPITGDYSSRGRAAAMPAALHAVISGRGWSQVSGILG